MRRVATRRKVGFAPAEDERTAAVFARVPVADAERLERAARALRRPKREILAALLSALDADGDLALGRAGFSPSVLELRDVLTLEEAAELLRADAADVAALAERGKIPGRKLGGEWRFARLAILDWLARR
jgi:excisionase family DNA binding protein